VKKPVMKVIGFFYSFGSKRGIQKLFGALARCGKRRTKILNRADKEFF